MVPDPVGGGIVVVVTPINTATNTAGKPIIAGKGQAGPIAITPDGKSAYVANWNSGTVTPICTATNTAGKPIKVGRKPADIAITPRPASQRSPPRRTRRATETRRPDQDPVSKQHARGPFQVRKGPLTW